MLTCPGNFAGEIRSAILPTWTPIEQVTFPSQKTTSKIIFFLRVQWNASADNKLTELSLLFILPLMWHFLLPRNCRPWQTVSGCLKNFKLQLKYNLLSFLSCFMTPDWVVCSWHKSHCVPTHYTSKPTRSLEARSKKLIIGSISRGKTSAKTILSGTTCLLAWYPVPPVGSRDLQHDPTEVSRGSHAECIF